jgi:hypothetical protein
MDQLLLLAETLKSETASMTKRFPVPILGYVLLDVLDMYYSWVCLGKLM